MIAGQGSRREGRPGVLRQLLAILLLPVSAGITVPALLTLITRAVRPGWGLAEPWAYVPMAGGAALTALGIALAAGTIRLFARLGRGMLAPRGPARQLVLAGPYRYVRNAMISGVGLVLLAEALLLGSLPRLVCFGVFGAVNAIYIPVVEEPDLLERFGAAYVRFRDNMPRWMPRLRRWEGA